MSTSPTKQTTYWDYIRVNDLLALQNGLEEDDTGLANEEVLFITVHQVFELWFKLVYRELRACRDLFTADRVAEQELSGAVRGMKRAVTLFRQLSAQFEVMETLTTREYLGFRKKLMPASGFQSAQMRKIEILFGLAEDERIPLGFEGSYKEALKTHDGSPSPALEQVEAALADTPTLKEVIDEWLFRTPIDGVAYDSENAESALDDFIERFLECTARDIDENRDHAIACAGNPEDAKRLEKVYAKEKDNIRAFLRPTEKEGGARTARIRTAMVFIVTYRELPLLSWPREFLDSLIELEQAFVIFRQRHARMVERVIGRRAGTGGSAGVEYLDKTALAYRIYRDLWAVRTIQLKKDAAPELTNPEFYGFR
jgi:tryptophan 2,3-dioxygenase